MKMIITPRDLIKTMSIDQIRKKLVGKTLYLDYPSQQTDQGTVVKVDFLRDPDKPDQDPLTMRFFLDGDDPSLLWAMMKRNITITDDSVII